MIFLVYILFYLKNSWAVPSPFFFSLPLPVIFSLPLFPSFWILFPTLLIFALISFSPPGGGIWNLHTSVYILLSGFVSQGRSGCSNMGVQLQIQFYYYYYYYKGIAHQQTILRLRWMYHTHDELSFYW